MGIICPLPDQKVAGDLASVADRGKEGWKGDFGSPL